MDRLRRQRGYTRLSKVTLLLLVAAAGYFGVAFWSPARTYFRVKKSSGVAGISILRATLRRLG